LGFGYPQFTLATTGVDGAWVSSSVMPATGAQIFDLSYSYATLSNTPVLGVNGAAALYQSATQPSGSIGDISNLIIGNNASGGNGWPGDICEVVLSRLPLSVTQTDAVRRNQAVFYGLPGVL
jgi:hypothetical protein